jgi:hypothetical protein
MEDEIQAGLNVAINEGTLLGVEVSRARQMAAITLAVLSLPDGDGPPSADTRVSILLSPVGRVTASLRVTATEEVTAEPLPLYLESLLEVVRSFGGQPVYGWDFINSPQGLDASPGPISLDERLSDQGHENSITLFQGGPARSLVIRIWFGSLRVFSVSRGELPLSEFIAGGRRWWDAMYAGDPRTKGSGITPLAQSKQPK